MAKRLLGWSGMVLGATALVLLGGCPFPPPPTPTDGTTPTDPAAFTSADAVRGGLLYDKWWTVAGVAEPTSDHALWASRPDATSNTRSGSATWRCKECHGWDYKGVSGAYGTGSHRTGIGGIFGTTLTAQETFDLIKDDHGYGDAGLSDDDIWDLAKFVLEGQIDTDTIINSGGAFSGSAAAGQTLYDSGIGTNVGCVACHGADGLTPPPGADADYDDFVGKIANDNPWEFQHKARFGQPGSAMPGSEGGGGTTQNVADLGAYAQTLPEEECADDETVARTYVGSATCRGCHQEIYETFMNSGHPYKLNRVAGREVPSYPFSSIAGALGLIDDDDTDPNDPGAGTDNSLGTPTSYNDVSFVIGGFGWKARFIDLDGYIITGSAVQYNLETEAMAGYHDNEVDKRYSCGNCHTTGWRAFTSEAGDTRNLNRQDDLPGMAGTFAEPGIQCEACHGGGSAHIANPPCNITRLATARTTEGFLADDMAYGKAVACSECHTRDGEKDYPTYEGGPGLIKAKGGFIRHHEQYDELLGINPDDADATAAGKKANMHCTACHDPHKTVVYQGVSGDGPGIKTECSDCHQGYEITRGGMQNLDCIDCHMPRLAKSAIAHAAVGSGPPLGDIRTHVFRIDLSKTEQFTDDGAFAYPWITVEYACKSCHDGVSGFDLPAEMLRTWTVHE